MPAILILGMDNTGKTTLINNMEAGLKSARTPVRVIKSPGPISSTKMVQWVSEQVILINDNPETVFLYDRFCCFDEPIYGPIMRGTKPQLIEPMLSMIKTVDPIIIYARPEANDIITFRDGRDQMEGVEQFAEELLMAYDHLILGHLRRFPVLVYDYNKTKAEEILDEALNAWISTQSEKVTQKLMEEIHFEDIFDKIFTPPARNSLEDGLLSMLYSLTSKDLTDKSKTIRRTNRTNKPKQMTIKDLERRGNY